jgi:hypothetical protein
VRAMGNRLFVKVTLKLDDVGLDSVEINHGDRRIEIADVHCFLQA